MADNISISITAETADLTAKLAVAQANLRAFSTETKNIAEAMRTAGKDGAQFFGAALQGAATDAAMAKAEVASLTAALGSSSGGLAGAAAMIRQAFGSITAIASFTVAGVSLRGLFEGFKDAADGAAKFDLEVNKLAVMLGTSLSEATKYAEALKLIGLSSTEYEMALFKLERGIKTNEKAINALGLATKDASGQMLPATTLMQNAIKVLEDYKEGTDRNQASLYLFQRGAQQMFEIFYLNDGVLKRAAEDLKDFGSVTDQSVRQSHEFEIAWASLGNTFDLAQNKIGRELQPSLIALADALSVNLKNAFVVIEPIFKVMLTAVEALTFDFTQLVNIIIQAALVPILLSESIMTALTKGPAAALDEYVKHYADVLKGFEDRSKAFAERMRLLWGGVNPDAGPLIPKGSKSFVDPKEAAASTANKAPDQALQNQRDLEREVNEELRARIGLVESGANIESAFYQRLDGQIRGAATLGRITAQQEYAELVTAENAKFAASERAIGDKMMLYRDDETAYKELLDKAQIATVNHYAVLDKLDLQWAQNQKKQHDKLVQDFTRLFDPITHAFDGMLTGLLQGTLTLRKAFANLAQNIITSFANMAIQWAVHWAAMQAAQAAAELFGETTETASQSAKTAIDVAAGFGQISIAAAVGAAQAGAAAAVLGPEAIAPAAAAAYAEIMGWAAGLGGAAFDQGTMNVPQTMMALVHSGEIITTPSLGDDIRAGRATLGGPGSGAAPNFNVSIQSNDPRSAMQMIVNDPTVFNPLLTRLRHALDRG